MKFTKFLVKKETS